MEKSRAWLAHYGLVSVFIMGFVSAESNRNTYVLLPYRDVAQAHLPSYGASQKGLDTVFAMFASLDSPHQANQTLAENCCAQMLRNTLDDLQMLCGQTGSAADSAGYHLLSKIDSTKTKFGRAALAKIIANSTNDVVTLHARQALIKELLRDKELFADLTDVCRHVAACESEVLPFWAEKNELAQKIYAQLYFKTWYFKQFNKNPTALEVGNRVVPLFNLVALIGAQAAIYGVADYGEKVWFTGKSGWGELWLSLEKEWGKLYSLTRMAQGQFYETTPDKQEDLDSYRLFTQRYTSLSNIAVRAIGIKGIYDYELARTQQLGSLQQRLVGVKNLLWQLTGMQKLLVRSPHLVDVMGGRDRITSLDNCLERCEDLKVLLETSTFATANMSMTTSVGRILAASRIFDGLKELFIDPLELLGQLDAYLSVATLYRNYQKTPVRYCFVEYVDTGEPYLNLHKMWNPLINKPLDQIGPNDIELGTQKAGRNVILTGSNTGGKSTLLKGITIDILLAQTIGLAAAHKAVLTPFACVGTSLNIKDNIAAGDSTFKAELLRAASLAKIPATLGQGEFAFMVIDELFKGTRIESAVKGSSKVVRKLNASKSTLYILATHFIELSKLEDESGGICKNYNIDAEKQVDATNGTITTVCHPYRLKRGASQINVADDMIGDALD